MSKFLMSCRQATTICNKSQYSESSFWERFRLKIHLIVCAHCKDRTEQNHKLTQTIKKSNIVCLDASTKQDMRENLKREMENTQLLG